MPDPKFDWLQSLIDRQRASAPAASDATRVEKKPARSQLPTRVAKAADPFNRIPEPVRSAAFALRGLARSSMESGENVAHNLNKGVAALRDRDYGAAALPLGLAIGETALNVTGGPEASVEKAVAKKRAPKILAAAIELPGGEQFIGRDHMHAVSQAMMKYPKANVSELLESAKDGFVDKAGNFHTREAVAKMKGKAWITAEHFGFNTDDARKQSAVVVQKKTPMSRVVTPKMEGMRDSRRAVNDRVSNALSKLDAPLPTADQYAPPLRVLDPSLIKLDEGVTKGPLPERMPFGDRQARGHMSALGSDQNTDLIMRQIERGKRMVNPHTGNPVMREFYPSYASVDDIIGNSGGDPVRFRKALSAAAIRNGVPGEIVNGSMMHWAMNGGGVINEPELLEMLKLPPDQRKVAFKDLAERMRKAGAQHAPDAQGFQLLPIHPQSYAGLLTDQFENYKIPWYDRQKVADIPGNVLDTHEATGGTLASPFHHLFAEQGGFKAAGEYGAHEQNLAKIFEHMGLSSREGQALRWGGGGGITGLRTPPTANYAQLFEQKLLENASHRNVDPLKLVRDVANGLTFLYNPR